MKVLGIDYGRRRIGLAVSDPDGICARSLTTIDRRRTPDTLPLILTHIDEERPDVLVVGLPLGADDQETEMSCEARAFAAPIGAASGLPVEFVDESFSSVEAHRLMRTRPKKKRRNKAQVDRMAACLIVESYLRMQDSASGW